MTAKKTRLIFVVFLFLFLFILFNMAYSLTTFTVTEGDLVKVKASVLDLDQDKVFISYSPPLNETGEWQTTLDDAGTYHTKITASDGISQTEKEFVIKVKNKNQPPKIEEKKIMVEETEKIDLKELVSDPDEDPLKLIFPKPFNEEGVWQTGYDDAGIYHIKISASDLEYKTTKTIEIEVKNKNRPPEILSLFSEDEVLSLTENTTFSFSVSAQDPDQDPLIYSWQLDGEEISQKPSFSHYFGFESSGEHKLTCLVSDHKLKTEKNWTLKVKNLNRPPQIEQPDIIVNEGETIILQLPETDSDHDPIKYTFTAPFQPDGTWSTTYNDAGTYTAKITASDGQLTTTKEINITIKNVDRPPVINLDKIDKKTTFPEDEELNLNLTDFISDPDGDELVFTIENLPPGAEFKDSQLQWLPGYDFVRRKPNFFTNFLNRLRLEKYIFPSYRKVPLFIHACGKELCLNQTLFLQVNNVNRPPLLEPLKPLTLTETETASLKPKALDPDQDYIKYYFEKPFNRKGEWQPDYDYQTKNQTEFFTTITASDGELTDTKTVKVIVRNKNRPPTLEIKQEHFKLNENQPFSLRIDAFDPDNDSLVVYAENLPPGASFQNQLFSWTPPYDAVTKRKPTFFNNLYAHFSSLNRRFSSEYKEYNVNFAVSDGEFTTIHPVLFTVKNVDRPPEVADYSPAKEISVKLNEPVRFQAFVRDPDQDNLTYSWSFGAWDQEIETEFNNLQRTFTEPGFKMVKVTATDGTYSAEHQWTVKVKAPQTVAPSPPVALTLPQPTPQPAPSGKFNVYVVKYKQ